MTNKIQELKTALQNELKKELEDRMLKLNPLEILKRMSSEAEEINKALKYRAFQKPIKVI